LPVEYGLLLAHHVAGFKRRLSMHTVWKPLSTMRACEKQTVSLQDATDHGMGDNQTYLRVAEIVLSKALSPLKAREIVDRGIEQGLFGDHVMSRTPEKSMQARLSIDILTR
jgi:HB1, ASXL, restriction endonuclease HTH domain